MPYLDTHEVAAFASPAASDNPRAAAGFRWTPEAVVDTTVVGNATGSVGIRVD